MTVPFWLNVCVPRSVIPAGLGAHLCRVVPNTAIMFTCYELVVRVWRINQERANNGEDLSLALHPADA